MTLLKNLRSFHKRAQALKKQLGSGREAWEQTEKEYFEIEGKNRYKNYKSFRINHWNCLHNFPNLKK